MTPAQLEALDAALARLAKLKTKAKRQGDDVLLLLVTDIIDLLVRVRNGG